MTIKVDKTEINSYIGKETGVSDWFHIDQDRITKFAEVTEDYQFIHVDPVAAAATPFGSTIAHGFLTLSMLSHLAAGSSLYINGTVMGINYGCEKIRFLAPVKVNSDIRARVKLLAVDEKPGNRFLMKSEITIEIKDEKTPALVAEWLTMMVVEA
ncbi:MaoC family dehydratase [Kordiimonas pumila]|uniref:MaoC family dehydratase n=1 Tax=Kordiimonas pumila TaxID=2161677 RepID=A0ABV7D1K7_9PROT|nr:MaoC family dehydratase [Kordiimonas pumila]